MPLKHAVLALLVERRGYGYDLAQRFRERVGPGWQLNPTAVYPALDQLERSGLVIASTSPGRAAVGTSRSPRVAYAATPAGVAALDAWLRTVAAAPEPLRSDLHLKLAFAAAEQRPALAAEVAARTRETAALLAACESRRPQADELHDAGDVGDAGACGPRQLIDAAVAAHLRADLAWLPGVRAALLRSSGA